MTDNPKTETVYSCLSFLLIEGGNCQGCLTTFSNKTVVVMRKSQLLHVVLIVDPFILR